MALIKITSFSLKYKIGFKKDFGPKIQNQRSESAIEHAIWEDVGEVVNGLTLKRFNFYCMRLILEHFTILFQIVKIQESYIGIW